MDEIKFKIALKVNDLYYFMIHHWFACAADHPMECDGCDG